MIQKIGLIKFMSSQLDPFNGATGVYNTSLGMSNIYLKHAKQHNSREDTLINTENHKADTWK